MVDNICSKFLETVARHPSRVAVEFARRGTWHDLNWAEYKRLVFETAAGLLAAGVVKGDRVAIWSNTRVEWAICDLAALSIGAIVVPIYPNSTKDDVEYALTDSAPKVLLCEAPELAGRVGLSLGGAKAGNSGLFKTVWFDSGRGSERASGNVEPAADGSTATTLDALQATGSAFLALNGTIIEDAIRGLSPADPASVIYTSGTTGRPKGVLLTHDQIMSEVSEAFPLLGATPLDKSLTFLPFAHVLGRIEIWGHALIGYVMAYAESIDKIKDGLATAKPTFMIAVPRIFEKIYAGVLAQADVLPLRKRVFDWAMGVGLEISKHKVDKMPVPLNMALQYRLAQRLVFKSLIDKMGGRLRFCVSGGAPLSQSISQFFHAAGLLILEGYGLTETTGAVCVNTPFAYQFGTVGKPIGETKIKIAEDGEILIKSRKVMAGYYKDEAATQAAFIDGWFKTGDIGELTSEGALRITDRKKELIKTAGGKYVAPQKLEGLLKAHSIFSHVHVVGDKRKYVVVLVTINEQAARAGDAGSAAGPASADELTTRPQTHETVRRAIAEANAGLASYESIKNFAILPRDFSVEGGELTPSLKVRRKVVEERYRDVIDRLYGGASASEA